MDSRSVKGPRADHEDKASLRDNASDAGADNGISEAPFSAPSQHPNSTHTFNLAAGNTKSALIQAQPRHLDTKTNDGGDKVSFLFLDDKSGITREKSFQACSSVDKLFSQAVCAKMVNPDDDAAVLSVGVADEDVRIMRGDKDDFEVLKGIIQDLMETEDRILELYVRAL